LGSMQAAKVQQAVLRLYGPGKAYAFHLKLYEARGAISGTTALAVAQAMGLDAKKVEESADSETVGQAVLRQTRLAESLGLAMTPSFIVAGTAILGWPGPRSLSEIVKNARACDQIVCEKKG
jgi:protein-disulfide isomerase